MLKMTVVSLALFGLTACSLIQTHPSRNQFYSSYEVPLDLKKEKSLQEFREVRKELGLHQTETLTEFQQRGIENRVTLRRLEKTLNNSMERQQYFQYKPFFGNDSQRIRFLQMPSVVERESYAASLGIDHSPNQITKKDQQAAEDNDLFVGMSRAGVKLSWGEPDQVEVAGSPIYGNERWMYSDYVPSPDGFVMENKLIYFEGGRVVGWEKR